MIGGVFLLRKRYAPLEYVSAIMLSGGLVIFTLADVSTRPQFDFRGVILLCGSLTADAFIGNLQVSLCRRQAGISASLSCTRTMKEKTLSEFGRPLTEMVWSKHHLLVRCDWPLLFHMTRYCLRISLVACVVWRISWLRATCSWLSSLPPITPVSIHGWPCYRSRATSV